MAQSKMERIANIEQEIKQLKERQKRILQQYRSQERKDRTKRLCHRMGLFESLVPDSISLTDEQFKTFLEKTVAAEHSRRILDGLTAQSAATATSREAETEEQRYARPAVQATYPLRESREDGDVNRRIYTRTRHENEDADESNGARESG